MWLTNKLEEIRKKPEHIRLRYVWGAVFISMFFIIIVWLLSLVSVFGKKSPGESTDFSPIKNSLEKFKTSTPSIQDINTTKENIKKASTQKNPEIENTSENEDAAEEIPPFEITE